MSDLQESAPSDEELSAATALRQRLDDSVTTIFAANDDEALGTLQGAAHIFSDAQRDRGLAGFRATHARIHQKRIALWGGLAATFAIAAAALFALRQTPHPTLPHLTQENAMLRSQVAFLAASDVQRDLARAELALATRNARRALLREQLAATGEHSETRIALGDSL